MKASLRAVLPVLLAALFLAPGAFAVAIDGAFNATGTVNVFACPVATLNCTAANNNGYIDWLTAVNGQNNSGQIDAGSTGQFEIGGGVSGVFAGMNGVTLNLIRDLSSAIAPAGGTNLGISAFLDLNTAINNATNWVWTLNNVSAGNFGPFTLSEQFGSTNASITLQGTVFDPNTPSVVSTWVGVISTQFANSSIAAVTAAASSTGGTVGLPTGFSTWSANFTATSIPEPGTYLLVGLGLVAAGFARRRRA